jgi:hypothetical protein
MTPVYKSDARTITLIERKATLTQDEERSVLHAAGGKFAGFVVNNFSPERIGVFRAAHFSFKFNVYVRNTASQQMQQVIANWLQQIVNWNLCFDVHFAGDAHNSVYLLRFQRGRSHQILRRVLSHHVQE